MPTNSETPLKVATANIAGAARQLNTQSRNLEVLAGILSGCDMIGLQEVVKVYSANGNIVRDDLSQLMKFAGLSKYHGFFFHRLDSFQHASPKKWGSAAFSEYYQENKRVLQGDAVLIKKDHFICDFWDDAKEGSPLFQAIPWYTDKPTFYLGNRNTEPRAMLLTRVKIGRQQVLYCCTHLSALSEENHKDGSISFRQPTESAIALRRRQVEWIVQYIQSYQDAHKKEPVILSGDFNAAPDAPELAALQSLDLQLVPFSGKSGNYTHRGHQLLIDLVFADRRFSGTSEIIDLSEYEDEDAPPISDHLPVISTLNLPESA